MHLHGCDDLHGTIHEDWNTWQRKELKKIGTLGNTKSLRGLEHLATQRA
jgi:hypothetical protein